MHSSYGDTDTETNLWTRVPGRGKERRINGPHFVEGSDKGKDSDPRGWGAKGTWTGGRCGPLATTTLLWDLLRILRGFVSPSAPGGGY